MINVDLTCELCNSITFRLKSVLVLSNDRIALCYSCEEIKFMRIRCIVHCIQKHSKMHNAS